MMYIFLKSIFHIVAFSLLYSFKERFMNVKLLSEVKQTTGGGNAVSDKMPNHLYVRRL